MSGPNRDQQWEDYLAGASAVTRSYRAAERSEPPRHVDDAIRAAARRAVDSRPRARFAPFGHRWVLSTAAAAVAILSVGLVVLMHDHAVTPAPPVAPRAAVPSLPERAAPPADQLRAPAAPQPLPDRLAGAARESQRIAEAAPPAEPRASPALAPNAKSAEAEQGARRRDAAPSALGTAAVAKAKRAPLADVVGVQVSGSAGAYEFVVAVRSPDTGCRQYADWWEVIDTDGRLRYRRVLLHSHVDEQPFTRSGGPVAIDPDTVVWVRAHMRPGGYGGEAMRGSVRTGFQRAELSADFAAGLATEPPLPQDCAF